MPIKPTSQETKAPATQTITTASKTNGQVGNPPAVATNNSKQATVASSLVASEKQSTTNASQTLAAHEAKTSTIEAQQKKAVPAAVVVKAEQQQPQPPPPPTQQVVKPVGVIVNPGLTPSIQPIQPIQVQPAGKTIYPGLVPTATATTHIMAHQQQQQQLPTATSIMSFPTPTYPTQMTYLQTPNMMNGGQPQQFYATHPGYYQPQQLAPQPTQQPVYYYYGAGPTAPMGGMMPAPLPQMMSPYCQPIVSAGGGAAGQLPPPSQMFTLQPQQAISMSPLGMNPHGGIQTSQPTMMYMMSAPQTAQMPRPNPN